MLKPTNNNVLVQLDKPKTTTEAGIELPQDNKNPGHGVIADVGPNCQGDWEVGQKVYFVRFEGHVIEHEDIKYNVLKEEDLLAYEKEKE